MKRYLALSGGVGGAKLAAGLATLLPPESLTVVVNTADDFDHLGLRICPDLDSVMYAMAGLNDAERGWGRAGESWQCHETLRSLGGPDWFRLGDRDLAVHLWRTDALRRGLTLTQATQALCTRLGIEQAILPMSDDAVATELDTVEGTLDFQAWFVGHACRPEVQALRYRGAGAARMTAAVQERLADPALAGVIVCPSNPYLSIDPILAVPELRTALRRACVPVIAVSPYVGGVAVKGPADRLARQLGDRATAAQVGSRYADFLHALVSDEPAVDGMPADVVHLTADTLMTDAAGRQRLARFCLETVHQMGRWL